MMLERLGPAEFSLLFDAVVAALLVATIVYAVILNRKLTQLRDARGEMERLLGGFVEATSRAERGLAALREAAGACGEELQRRTDKGNAVHPGNPDPEAQEAADPSPAGQALRQAEAAPEKNAFMEALRGIR
jgi:hypothetical protein